VVYCANHYFTGVIVLFTLLTPTLPFSNICVCVLMCRGVKGHGKVFGSMVMSGGECVWY